MKTITVIIGFQGEIKVEPAGFEGRSCRKATAELERALGLTKAQNLKPEYYQRNAVGQAQALGHSTTRP